MRRLIRGAALNRSCIVPGRAVPLPPNVRAALAAIFGDDVDTVRIVEHSWFARLHGRVVATTRTRRIYLRGTAAAFFCDPALMLHEYCHVLLQWECGALTTPRYVREWLKRGYRNNRFEVEARAFARTHLDRLHELLARDGLESAPVARSIGQDRDIRDD